MKWDRLIVPARRLLSWPVRSLWRVTPEGALFLALALFCGLLSLSASRWSNIPLLICLVLVALWLLSMWQGTRAVRCIQFKRSHPERTFANEPVTVAIQVSNTSRFPSTGLFISEELEPSVPVMATESGSQLSASARQQTLRPPVVRSQTFIMAVPGRGSDRSNYTVNIRRRGIYNFGPARLETVFPFGFFRSASLRQAAGRLVVYPRLGEVNTALFQELDLALQNLRRARPSRAENDFRGLREYRKEDSPKWIHWRSSARLQKLVVREFEEPQSKRVLILLDTNLQRLGTRRFAAFELAISFAGTLARDLTRRGLETQCIALQPSKRAARVTLSRERRNLDVMLEMLAGLRRDDSRTLGDLIEYIPRRSLHNVYVVLIGLGSLRFRPNMNWLRTPDNVVRFIDARGDEFRQVFQPAAAGSAREESVEEDLLLSLGDEESVEEAVNSGDRGSVMAFDQSAVQ